MPWCGPITLTRRAGGAGRPPCKGWTRPLSWFEHRPRWNVGPHPGGPGECRVGRQGPRPGRPAGGGWCPGGRDPRIGKPPHQFPVGTVGEAAGPSGCLPPGASAALVPGRRPIYEWRKVDRGETPHWIARPHRGDFLPGRACGIDGGPWRRADPLLRDPHHEPRSAGGGLPSMPGCRWWFPRRTGSLWLDPRGEGRRRWQAPTPVHERLGSLRLGRWSTLSNRPANDGPELLEVVPGTPERP